MEKLIKVDKSLTWEELSEQIVKYGTHAPCIGGITSDYDARRNTVGVYIKFYVDGIGYDCFLENHFKLEELSSFSDLKKTRYKDFTSLALSCLNNKERNKEFVNEFKYSFTHNYLLEKFGFFDDDYGKAFDEYTIECLEEKEEK